MNGVLNPKLSGSDSVISLIDKKLEQLSQRNRKIQLELEHNRNWLQDSEVDKGRHNALNQELADISVHMKQLEVERNHSTGRQNQLRRLEALMRKASKEIGYASETVYVRRIEWSKMHNKRNVAQSRYMSDLMHIFKFFYKDVEARLKGINSGYEGYSKQFDEQLVELRRSHRDCNRTKECNKNVEEIQQAKQLIVDRLQVFIDAEKEREKIMVAEHAAYGKISQECKI